MWFYLAWIPAAAVFYAFAAIFTKWANDDPAAWRWFFVLYFMQAFGLWPIVAKFSKDIIFDSFLFDAIIFSAYFVTLFALGAGSKFTTVQWTGTTLLIVGFILLKIGAR